MGGDPVTLPRVGPSSGGSGDPVDNLENFIAQMAQASGRLIDRQEALGGLDAELDGRSAEQGRVFTTAEARLEQFTEELQASGQEAAAGLEALAQRGDAVGGKEVPAATDQIVHLDGAIEAQASQAMRDVQGDATALDHDGFDALTTTCTAVEQGVEGARQALEAAFQTFAQEMEDTTRLVESTGGTVGDRIDQHAQEVTQEAQRFTAAAADATRVWSEELPGLLRAALPTREQEVQELYRAWDEAEVEGYTDFKSGSEKSIEDAHELLDQKAEALQKATDRAEDGLDGQSREATATFVVAREGAETLSGLAGGSFVSEMKHALGVVDTIDELLKAL